MSQWIEVSLRVDGEAAEAAAQELHKWCTQGVAIEQPDITPDKWDDGEVPPSDTLILRGYFADDKHTETTKEQINRAIGYLNMMYPMPKPVYSIVNEEDWAEAWKAHYTPVRLGRNILIHPRWIEVQTDADDLVISLDPGMAFGTGTHPTTQLCLEALEDTVTAGLDVLDLGCGSGILAIGAVKLGASHVVAVDIDPIAVKTTIENAEENGVAERITCFEGSLESIITSARRFDLIVVNILAKIIIGMCDQHLGQTVRPNGRAIFSGIIVEQAEAVEQALIKTGLTPTARRQQGDWLVIEAVRQVD